MQLAKYGSLDIQGPLTLKDQTLSRFSVNLITDATTARTLTSSDNGSVIVFSSSSAITLTFTNSLPTGFNVMVIQRGSGAITWAGTGVTFYVGPSQTGHTKSNGANSRVSFTWGGSNAYDVIGDTTT